MNLRPLIDAATTPSQSREPMPRYRVVIPVYAAWQSIIEADSADEAIDAAETGSICAHCQGWGKRDDSQPSLFVNDDAIWEDAEAEVVDE